MASENETAGLPGISLADARMTDPAGKPWNWRLFVFLRGLAVLQFAKGLAYWAALLLSGGSPDPMAGVSTAWLVACAFFAVADPVAAVGLWLGAAWGVAIWLLAAIGQIAAVALDGSSSVAAIALTVAAFAAMGVYVVLSVKARLELD
jgi:hypothetical protein